MDVTNSASVIAKIQGLRDLPVLSVVREQGLDLLKNRVSTRRDLAHTLKYDQVLSAKILRLVNSSSYGLQRSVGDVEQALSFVGDHSIHTLLLSSNSFLEEDLSGPFKIREYWLHNYMVGFVAALLADKTQSSNPSEAFACGLLHDLGKLALWKSDKELFLKVLHKKESEGISFLEAESALMVPGHHVLGEEVARVWRLPFEIRKVMRFHHRDATKISTLEKDVQSKIMLVALANHLVKTLSVGCAWGVPEGALADVAARALNVDSAQLQNMERAITLEHERLEALWPKFFTVKGSSRAAAF